MRWATGPWTTISAPPSPQIREKVGGSKVLLALSGGVDSSVYARPCWPRRWGVAHLCVRGPRPDAQERGRRGGAAFSKWAMNFVRVDAEARFLEKLAGVDEPERKRKIIGEEFIRVFEEEAKKIGTVDFLAQGTIYP